MQSTEQALVESRSLREQFMSRTEVLDRVKSLTLLADGFHATTEIVAAYYDVDGETIKKLVQRHRHEMIQNGYRVLKGDELRELKRDNVSLLDAKSLALFTKRTMLNIGQLLTGSAIAQAVRSRLLDDHETARGAVSDLIPAGAPIAQAEEATAIIRMLAVGVEAGLLDRGWAAGKAQLRVARVMGEEPELPAEVAPLYVPDFLKGKGLTKKEIKSVESWFGRRAVEMGEANGFDNPVLRPTEQTNGSIRETRAWRGEHLPLFEMVWDTYYAEKFARPMVLELGAA